jgi:membrane protein required for colicin V production
MNVGQFNSLDVLLIAIVGTSTVFAFSRGIVRTVFGMVGVIAGIAIASWNYEALADLLNIWIGNLEASRVTAFLLIVILVMMAATLLAKLVRKTAKTLGLSLVDSLLGAAFGFLRGMLAGIALVMAVTAFLPRNDWVAHSKLSSYFLAGAHAVSFVVPPDLEERIANGAPTLKHD